MVFSFSNFHNAAFCKISQQLKAVQKPQSQIIDWIPNTPLVGFTNFTISKDQLLYFAIDLGKYNYLFFHTYSF